MKSSEKQSLFLMGIRKGLVFCEVCGFLFIYVSCYVHGWCCRYEALKLVCNVYEQWLAVHHYRLI